MQTLGKLKSIRNFEVEGSWGEENEKCDLGMFICYDSLFDRIDFLIYSTSLIHDI